MWLMAAVFDRALLTLFLSDLALNLFGYQKKNITFCPCILYSHLKRFLSL